MRAEATNGFKIIGVEAFDLGFQLGLVIEHEGVRSTIKIYDLPVPLDQGTVAYSIRNQGLEKSMKNNFLVSHC